MPTPKVVAFLRKAQAKTMSTETPPGQHRAVRLSGDTQIRLDLRTVVAIVVVIASAIVWATTVHIQLDAVRDDIAQIKVMLKDRL